MHGEMKGLVEAFEGADDPMAYRSGRSAFEARLRFAEGLSAALVRATGARIWDGQRLPTREQYEDHQAWVRILAPYLSRFRAANPGKLYPTRSTGFVWWAHEHSVTWAELDAELSADDLTFEEHSEAGEGCTCDACDRVRRSIEHASLQRFGESAGGLRDVRLVDLRLEDEHG